MQVTRLNPYGFLEDEGQTSGTISNLKGGLNDTYESSRPQKLPTTHLGKQILSKPNQKSQDKSIVLAGFFLTAAMFSETVKTEVSSN